MRNLNNVISTWAFKLREKAVHVIVLRSKDDNINAHLEKVEWASNGM